MPTNTDALAQRMALEGKEALDLYTTGLCHNAAALIRLACLLRAARADALVALRDLLAQHPELAGFVSHNEQDRGVQGTRSSLRT